jgi:hypothetical protein
MIAAIHTSGPIGPRSQTLSQARRDQSSSFLEALQNGIMAAVERHSMGSNRAIWAEHEAIQTVSISRRTLKFELEGQR